MNPGLQTSSFRGLPTSHEASTHPMEVFIKQEGLVLHQDVVPPVRKDYQTIWKTNQTGVSWCRTWSDSFSPVIALSPARIFCACRHFVRCIISCLKNILLCRIHRKALGWSRERSSPDGCRIDIDIDFNIDIANTNIDDPIGRPSSVLRHC